jgi:hypothetical protein
MVHKILAIALLSGTVGLSATGLARADCESDLIQLEEAFKAPNLSTDAKAALEVAKKNAVAALKKDDDVACHKAVEEGVAKAGLKMK